MSAYRTEEDHDLAVQIVHAPSCASDANLDDLLAAVSIIKEMLHVQKCQDVHAINQPYIDKLEYALSVASKSIPQKKEA